MSFLKFSIMYITFHHSVADSLAMIHLFPQICFTFAQCRFRCKNKRFPFSKPHVIFPQCPKLPDVAVDRIPRARSQHNASLCACVGVSVHVCMCVPVPHTHMHTLTGTQDYTQEDRTLPSFFAFVSKQNFPPCVIVLRSIRNC